MNACPNCNNKIPLQDKFFKIHLNYYQCGVCKCNLRLSKIVLFHFMIMLFLTSLIYRNLEFSQLFVFCQFFNMSFFLFNVWVSNPVKLKNL